LAAKLGGAAVATADNRDALNGADAVILALRFTALEGVIEEIADALTDKLVVVPSNPVGLDPRGDVSRLLPKEQSSGEVVAAWLPAGARLAMAFGTMSASLLESAADRSPEPAVISTQPTTTRRRGGRALDPDGRFRAAEGRRGRPVRPPRGRWRPPRCGRRPRRSAVAGRRGVTHRQGAQDGGRQPLGSVVCPTSMM
jgi:hypothetical protein